MKECDTLRKKVSSSVEPDSADNNENGIDVEREAVQNVDEKNGLDHKESVIVDDAVKIKLTAQSLIVDALKEAIRWRSVTGIFASFSRSWQKNYS